MALEVPVYWDTWFGSADPDGAARLAPDLGGTLVMGPVDTEHGRISVLSDPSGAVFSVSLWPRDPITRMSANGKVGIVTGAGSGLGEASAKRLAREGAKVIVADRDQNSAERVAAEIRAEGGDATPLVVDVSVFEDTQKLVDTAVASYGRLDLAFNNAGITPALVGVHEIDPADWLAVISVNLTGIFYCMKSELRTSSSEAAGRSSTRRRPPE